MHIYSSANCYKLYQRAEGKSGYKKPSPGRVLSAMAVIVLFPDFKKIPTLTIKRMTFQMSNYSLKFSTSEEYLKHLFILFYFILFYFILFYLSFLSFSKSGFLCVALAPGTHSVDQAGLQLRNPPVSASQVLGLKALATTARLIQNTLT